jgi:hypothetical protein
MTLRWRFQSAMKAAAVSVECPDMLERFVLFCSRDFLAATLGTP